MVLCKSEAAMQALSPTARPAEISVPVRTIAPPIPRAIGSLAAVKEIMFITEAVERNLGFSIAIIITERKMIINIALLRSVSVIFLRFSERGRALKLK